MMNNLMMAARAITTQSELMEGREKGDMKTLVDIQPITISDFDFADDGKGEQYAIFTIKEHDATFFFGGGVITDHLKKLDAGGYKSAIQNEGLPVRFEKKMSQNKRFYTNAILFPESN